MPDNTRYQASLDLAQPLIADKEVLHSGDQAKVQLIALVEVTGTEGAYTLRELAGLDTLLATLQTTLTNRLPAALAGNGSLKSGSVTTNITSTVVIATDATTSTAVDTDGARNLGLVIPSTFDGTVISFRVSVDDVTYQSLYDITGTLVSMTVAASRSYDLPGELMAWRYFKILCATAQATTNTVFVVSARS